MRKPTAARAWAYTGAIIGAGVSVAANVLHSYVPPAGVAPGWRPADGAVFGAIFWPLALLVAIEIFARWHPTRRSGKWLRFLGLIPVAVVAAVVSYRHMSGLLDYWREDPVTVYLGPLAVDGLMTMAASALIETSGRRTWATSPLPASWPTLTGPLSVQLHTSDPGPGMNVTPPGAPADGPPAEVDLLGSPLPPAAPPVERDLLGTPTLRLVEQQTAKAGAHAPGGIVERLRTARTEHPAATQQQIADRVGVSKRTAARWWDDSRPPTNGTTGGTR